jgi:polyisoprenoid-binding protein YceI
MTRYEIDFVHSTLGFSVRHLLMTRVHGSFAQWTGTFEIDHSNPSNSRFAIDIDAKSIDTRNAQRDAHLKSPDFFDVERFPRITFVAQTVAPEASGMRISGPLTLHGVTKPVTFVVTGGSQAKDSQGRLRIGYRAEGLIRRSEFGVSWDARYEPAVPVVADEVELVLDLQLIPNPA